MSAHCYVVSSIGLYCLHAVRWFQVLLFIACTQLNGISAMGNKKQFRPGFELGSPCYFPTAVTTTPREPPYIYIYIYRGGEKEGWDTDCVCICVCLKERRKTRERVCVGVCMNFGNVCMCVCVCVHARMWRKR